MPLSPTPLVATLEGQLLAGTEFFTFVFAAPALVSRARVTVLRSSASPTTVRLLKNGAPVGAALVVPGGGQDSGLVDFTAVEYTAPDVLRLRVASADDDDAASAATITIYWSYASGLIAGGPYYSDPIDQVRHHLRNIGVGDRDADSMTVAKIQEYQAATDRYIDGALQPAYFVPLLAITRGGQLRYPDPIPQIARRMTAAHITMDVYHDVEPNLSLAAKNNFDAVDKWLGQLAAKGYFLTGQRRKARNSGSDPITEPASQPAATAAAPAPAP